MSNYPLAEALAQLDLGGQSSQTPGDINELPNEILKAILVRVSAHRLIPLRRVSHRWKGVIESVCRDKKCLMIMCRFENYYVSKLLIRFNGQLKLNGDFVFIQPRHIGHEWEMNHLSGQLCTFLVNLFPNIEQLLFNGEFSCCSPEFESMLQQWSLTTVSLNGFTSRCGNNLYAQVNQMTSVKRLDLDLFTDGQARRLTTALAGAEHFSASDYSVIIEIVSFLKAGITTSFGTSFVTLADITKLRNVNARFVSSLVRFSLLIWYPKVLDFICEHFTSLQMLHIDTFGRKLTIGMIDQLARLTNLTDLRFEDTQIDLVTLDVIARLVAPLDNIRAFALINFTIVTGLREHNTTLPPDFNFHQFAQILSSIFPNVQKLTIKSNRYRELATLLEAHVNLFANLRSHDFSLNNPFDRLMD